MTIGGPCGKALGRVGTPKHPQHIRTACLLRFFDENICLSLSHCVKNIRIPCVNWISLIQKHFRGIIEWLHIIRFYCNVNLSRSVLIAIQIREVSNLQLQIIKRSLPDHFFTSFERRNFQKTTTKRKPIYRWHE